MEAIGDEKSYSMDSLLFLSVFLIGAGVSMGSSTLYGSISYFSEQFGSDAFIWVNVMVNFPSLPVALYQLYKRKFEESGTPQDVVESDCKRLIRAFAVTGVLIFSLPFVHNSLVLYLLSFVVGVIQANTFCIGFRLMTTTAASGNTRYLQAGLAFGYQGSSIFILTSQLLSGFQTDSSISIKMFFYGLNSVFALSGILGVRYFQISSNKFDDHNQYTLMEEADEGADISWKSVFKDIWHLFISIFFTISASVMIFPFYAYVSSSSSASRADDNLARNLFYVKTLCDTISRPLTVVLPRMIQSRWVLLATSTIRLLFIPFFFLYTFSSRVPHNDVTFCILIGIFSFFSGYLKTTSYQFLSSMDTSSSFKRTASDILNIGFQLAVELGIILGIVLRFTVIRFYIHDDDSALPNFNFLH